MNSKQAAREATLGRWLLAILVGSLVLGSAASIYWFVRNESGVAMPQWAEFEWWIAFPIVFVTAFSIGVRFVRWHYLTKAAGIVVPTRDSLRVFIAGLAMALTPAYVGEVAKAFMLRSLHGKPVLRGVTVVVFERLLDFLALGIIAIAASLFGKYGMAVTAGAGVVLLASALGRNQGRMSGRPPVRSERLRGPASWSPSTPSTLGGGYPTPWPRVALTSVALSLVAWSAVAPMLALAVRAAGGHVGLLSAVRVFALSSMLGGVTLIPAGIGVTGSTMVLELVRAGVAPDVATVAAVLFRLGTIWLSVGVGVVVLASLAKRFLLPSQYLVLAHFDRLAPSYADQIQTHMQRHFVLKKIDAMSAFLPNEAGLRGGDLGCGWGWYAREMASRFGFRMVALDYSREQIRMAAHTEACEDGNLDFKVGDIRSMPIPDASLDFAYSVNTFHHLSGHDAQWLAFSDVARVLKPGGVFFLHEMNVVNPLFRFYLNYIFPLLRGIDEGTESWLLPYHLDGVPGLRLLEIKYFTWLPDFLPFGLLRTLRGLESRLESGRFARFGAHYMAVFIRTQ